MGPEDQAWDPMESERHPIVKACSASPVKVHVSRVQTVRYSVAD